MRNVMKIFAVMMGDELSSRGAGSSEHAWRAWDLNDGIYCQVMKTIEEQSETLAVVQRIPNALSIARIPLSLSILLVQPFSALFFALYVLCGATDALDGFIARKFNATSALGARLDSVADFVFFGAALYVFLTALAIPAYLIIWAIVIVAVRFMGLGRAFSKYKEWAALHTYAYKIAGFVFFCFPFLAALLGVVTAGIMLCGIATLATAEEIYINEHADVLDVNIRGASELRDHELPRGK